MITFDNDQLQGHPVVPRGPKNIAQDLMELLGELGMHPDSCDGVRDCIMQGITPPLQWCVTHLINNRMLEGGEETEEEFSDEFLVHVGLDN